MSNDWSGPTHGQWRETVRDIEATRDVANQNARSAQQWKAHAEQVEQQLKAMTSDRDQLLELYREAFGNTSGQRRVKEALIEALQKADPSNKLLDQPVRQQLFDAAKAEALKEPHPASSGVDLKL